MKIVTSETDTATTTTGAGRWATTSRGFSSSFAIEPGEGVIQMTHLRTRVTAALFALAPVAVVIATAAPRVRI
jgi:hypothetical protein